MNSTPIFKVPTLIMGGSSIRQYFIDSSIFHRFVNISSIRQYFSDFNVNRECLGDPPRSNCHIN